MAWTKQQQDAIDARDCSIIVSAAAGSGKTAVLVERLVKQLTDKENKVRADRMIVTTFTNDAAAEVKQRLNSKLLSEINANPNDTYIAQQYMLLQNAKISTITSFCFELIRDNIDRLDITSDFSILDEADHSLIKSEALAETMDIWCKSRSKDVDFLYDKFCIEDDGKILEVAEQIDKFLSSVAMRDVWMEKTANEFSLPVTETVYYKAFLNDAIDDLNYALLLATANTEMVTKISKNTPEKNIEQADGDLSVVKTLLAFIQEYDATQDINIVLQNCTFGTLKSVSKTIPHDMELRERFKANREKFKETVSQTLEKLEFFIPDFIENGKIFSIFCDFLNDYYKILWSKKVDKNSISFDDGERIALELLAEIGENGEILQSQLAQSLAEHYDIIMIDEYQDSNDKQDLIFKLLSKGYRLDGQNLPLYGKNAFIVGDVKQSIYKFRLANPVNFINTMNCSAEYCAENHSDNACIKLNKNFRSSAQVIDYINFVFKTVMSQKCGDVEYQDSEMLYFGAEEFTNDTENITEIIFIDRENDENDNAEAIAACQKIKNMLEQKVEVRLKDGSARPCEPKDFCILIRQNKAAKKFVECFKKFDINARAEEEKGYIKSREIAILLDVLRIINNPLDDVAIATVMLSPMFMFTAEDLAKIRIIDMSQYIYLILDSITNKNIATDDLLYKKCFDFVDKIKTFRQLSVIMSVEELIKRIYDTTDFITVMQLQLDGEKKRANLRSLIRHANKYESASTGNLGVAGFVRYINRILEQGGDFEQGKISSASENFVAIKTVHKSKGLEFPFVFLVELHRRYPLDLSTVQCNSKNMIGFTVFDNKTVRRYRTVAYSQIAKKNSSEMLSEQMRLLYVALTRAKQKIFINLSFDDKILKSISDLTVKLANDGFDFKNSAVNAKNPAAWIWMSLISHSKFSEIAERLGINPYCLPQSVITQTLFNYSIYSPQEITESTDNRVTSYSPDKNLINELSAMINFEYNKILSKMPSKLSITQLAEKFGSEDSVNHFSLKKSRITENTRRLTGAERGTAIHTFFQYCNFSNAINDVENELCRLIDAGYLTEVEAASIPAEKVKAFFENDLYRRITEAKSITREMKFMISVADLPKTHNFNIQGGMIKGIMDLVIEENDGLVLVDYKSDINSGYDGLKSKYEVQMALYKVALELITQKKVKEVYLYSFELEKQIQLV